MTSPDKMNPVQALPEILGGSDEAILSAVLDITPECIKIVGRDGTLLYMNSAGLQMVGAKDLDSVQGDCIFDVIAPEHRETWAANHNRVCEGERLVWEFDIIDANGVRHSMETHAAPLKMKHGTCAQLAITRDITRRKENQRKLHASKVRAREVLESIPAAVYTTDMDGNITYFNDAAVEFAGKCPEPDQKMCVVSKLYTLDGDPMPHEECPTAIALKERRPVRGTEAIAERPDGTRRFFKSYPTPLLDESGAICGAINMLIDTTDRHAADDNSAYLAAIVASSDDAIVSKTLEGRVTSWNAGAERIFGYTAEEMIGQTIHRIIPQELRGEEDQILARLRSGQRIDHFDTVRVSKDGRRVDVSITVSPVRGHSGRLIGASKVARDVTQRKHSENLRNLLVEELNHRVKNTLATVQAIANQTLRHASDAPDFAASFTGRLQSLARTHTLLTQNTWQGAELLPLLRDQLLVDADDRRVTMTGPAVLLDPQAALHLALVVHELATNARKYGALSVGTGRVSVDWSVEAQTGQNLLLTWREQGGPPVSAPTKRGFGATLIEQSMRARGGEAILSYKADGVTCEIRLPLIEARPNPHFAALGHEQIAKWARPTTAGTLPSLAGKRLIVVEDEPLIAMDLAACLSDLGCEVVGTATTLEGARQLLDTASFDAALLDANLGGEPVDELAAALTRSMTPFAFVTGYGKEGLPPAFQSAPLINKPVGIEQLRGVLAQLLQRHSADVLEYRKS